MLFSFPGSPQAPGLCSTWCSTPSSWSRATLTLETGKRVWRLLLNVVTLGTLALWLRPPEHILPCVLRGAVVEWKWTWMCSCLCMFGYMHACFCMCLSVHVSVEAVGQFWVLSFWCLFCDKVSTGLKLTKSGWLMSSREAPAPECPGLALTRAYTHIAFSVGLGLVYSSIHPFTYSFIKGLCSPAKHFIGWAISPALWAYSSNVGSGWFIPMSWLQCIC